MSAGPRWPRAIALPIAREICIALKPVTARLLCVGSLRRGLPTVGDVDIVYVPAFEERQMDMFTTAPMNLAEERIGQLLASGVLSKRPDATGGFSWGAQNKNALHREGVGVDLFSATEETWWNLVVCRTGPLLSNIRLAEAAQKIGWKWHPYGKGFSRGGPLAGDSEEHIVTSEEDAFAFARLPYREPNDRL